MGPPVMVDLGDEDIVSITVHASIDMAGGKVLRIGHTTCLDPMDRPSVAYQNFVHIEGVTLILSPDFCTLFQMLSCLSDIYRSGAVVSENHRDGHEMGNCIQSPS